VTAIHNARGGLTVEAALSEGRAGRYGARLPLPRPGRWELRIDAVRGGERFRAVLHRDARLGRGG
jgi:hypothetical protein